MSRIEALDATGLLCPLPVLKARKAMKALAPGDVLELRATDAAARRDVPAFCEAAGHILLETRQEGEILTFRIEKGA